MFQRHNDLILCQHKNKYSGRIDSSNEPNWKRNIFGLNVPNAVKGIVEWNFNVRLC